MVTILDKTVSDAPKPEETESLENFKRYEEYLRLSEIYQAYNLVNKFLEENHSALIQGTLFNESIFNAARFLVNNMPKKNPAGISKVSVFYALATLGFKYENYKTARFGYEQLQNFKVPACWIEEIEVDSIKLRAKPFSDKEEFSW